MPAMLALIAPGLTPENEISDPEIRDSA